MAGGAGGGAHALPPRGDSEESRHHLRRATGTLPQFGDRDSHSGCRLQHDAQSLRYVVCQLLTTGTALNRNLKGVADIHLFNALYIYTVHTYIYL